MADYLEFPGRTIDSLMFTALVESLTRVALVTRLIIEESEGFSKADLVDLIQQVNEETNKAMACAGTTLEESKAMNENLAKGFGVSRE
jgi:hypothetical protein